MTVFVAPDGRIITGSQDGIVKIWNEKYEVEKEWKAHLDIIRGFAEFSGVGFVTCSNDQKAKVWTYEGDLIDELIGHSNYVFSVTTLPNGTIVTGSEDRYIKIWKEFQCVQSIEIPDSIWDIQVNSKNDIIIACQDNRIYTFTRDPARKAVGKELAEFEANITAANTTEDLNIETLPDAADMPKYPGKKEGEIKVFKENGLPKAYMWKTAERIWELIGDVQLPSAPPTETVKYYEGDRLFEAGEYDHIFDIEIGDGVLRKLPFNNGGNPDEAANKFCVREKFGKSNIEQIMQHIKKNSVEYPTRDISATGGKPAAVTKPKLTSIPMRTQLFFDSVKTGPAAKKIKEIDEELKSIGVEQVKNLDRLIQVIEEKHLYHSSQLYKLEWDVFKILLSWPTKHMIPVLDLFRMFLLHSQASEMFKIFEHG